MIDQSESSLSTSQSYAEKTKGQAGEIEDISCCQDKSKRMSVCSSEVCNLSEKRSAIKAMAPLLEDPVRASPIPFSRGEVVNESFGANGQETVRKSENVQTSEEGNVHITRKTKVEESFVRSQKMYTAEISSSQSAVQIRAASPELEQIMTRKQVYQSYDSSRLTPQLKHTQPERCLTPEIENLMEKPHGSWSPMPPACMVRPISPHAIISYPPDIPSVHPTIPQPRIATPEQFQEAREMVERFVDHSKHVNQSQAVASGRTTQSYQQQSFTQQQQHQQQQQQQQHYTPRYDMSESFSAYNVRGNGYSNGNPGIPSNYSESNGNPGNPANYGCSGNGNPGNHSGNGNPGNYSGNGNPGNHSGNGNPGNHSGNGNPGNHSGNGNPGNHHGNGNPGRNNSDNNGETAGNSNPSNQDDEENPTVTEPDDSDEKYSRKSSGQSQKSRKSEEESSRRVFTDFGGPRVMTSVDVESTLEGGRETTSVKKSEKMEYSSCEFESTRTSSIIEDNGGSKEGKPIPSESRKPSYPKFTAEASVDEEETVTKSQVEQIIKQELNKVFQMAQAMDKTNLNEMYDQRSQQSSKAQFTSDKATEQSSQKVAQTVSSSNYFENKSYSGEAVTKTGKLTSGLTIAPERSFTPQPLESNYPLTYQNIPSDFPPPKFPPGEPKPECKPGYIPVTGTRGSPMLQALTIAPDRPYSPLPTATVVETPPFITAPKLQASSMLEALTTAPSTAFTFGESNITIEESSSVKKTTKSNQESVQKFVPKPSQGDFKPISAAESDSYNKYASLGQSVEKSTVKSYQPVTDQLKSAFKSTSKVQSQTTQAETQESIKSHQRNVSASKIERPLTPSGLHPPDLLPYYQRNIGEIPLAHRSNSPVPHQIKAPELKPPRPDSVPHPSTERRGSVKALSEAYNQQIEALNNKYLPTPTDTSLSSVSYVSAGAYSSGSVTKAYSYEQDHKSIDAMGYHPSPLAGKRTPLAGERTIPKCSSPVLGKLDHTKQVFKPTVSAQSPIAEQANLRQAPPFFTQEKEKPPTPWVVIKEDKENAASFKLPPPPKPATRPSLPTFPIVNKAPAFPEPPKPSPSLKPSSVPDVGPGGAKGTGTTAGTTAPRRGRGVLNAAVGAGGRVPLCGSCNNHIRGPFITALGKIWCPDHFVCVNAQCRRPLQDIGFVEEEQGLYCEYCFEQYLAPQCNKCNAKIKGDCLNAIGKHFHPECFTCAYCGKLFGNSPFFLEDALPYCETDWNELFTTKCFSCGFPIEAGDRWVEALNNNYHSQCFSCTMCKKNLEGQSFFAKGGRPFCKNHAR